MAGGRPEAELFSLNASELSEPSESLTQTESNQDPNWTLYTERSGPKLDSVYRAFLGTAVSSLVEFRVAVCRMRTLKRSCVHRPVTVSGFRGVAEVID